MCEILCFYFLKLFDDFQRSVTAANYCIRQRCFLFVGFYWGRNCQKYSTTTKKVNQKCRESPRIFPSRHNLREINVPIFHNSRDVSKVSTRKDVLLNDMVIAERKPVLIERPRGLHCTHLPPLLKSDLSSTYEKSDCDTFAFIQTVSTVASSSSPFNNFLFHCRALLEF